MQGRYAKGVWSDKADLAHFSKYYPCYLADVIQTALAKAKLTLSDMKFIFPHNVNVLSWSKVLNLLDAPADLLYSDNISRTAHCFGSDPFINFRDAVDAGKLAPGDKYILASSGLGAAFSAIVVEY